MTEDSRIVQENKKQRKDSEELSQQRVQFSEGWREGLEIRRERERKGYSVKYRSVGLILIPGRKRELIITG